MDTYMNDTIQRKALFYIVSQHSTYSVYYWVS